jgi:hypothetical protein
MFASAPPIDADVSFVYTTHVACLLFRFASHFCYRYFLAVLQMLVVNLITMNIIIAVLNSRYGKLTLTFSREKYEQWLTLCLADFVFKREMIRGGRCRAFLLHVQSQSLDRKSFKRPLSFVESLQLRLMIAAEYIVRCSHILPLTCECDGRPGNIAGLATLRNIGSGYRNRRSRDYVC